MLPAQPLTTIRTPGGRNPKRKNFPIARVYKKERVNPKDSE